MLVNPLGLTTVKIHTTNGRGLDGRQTEQVDAHQIPTYSINWWFFHNFFANLFIHSYNPSFYISTHFSSFQTPFIILMARQQSTIGVSNHPFLEFFEYPNFCSKAYGLIGRSILHGCRIDPAQSSYLVFLLRLNVCSMSSHIARYLLLRNHVMKKSSRNSTPLSNSIVHMQCSNQEG